MAVCSKILRLLMLTALSAVLLAPRGWSQMPDTAATPGQLERHSLDMVVER